MFPLVYDKERLVTVDQISFARGERQIFREFSLEIRSGDRIALKGRNGCGKSTPEADRGGGRAGRRADPYWQQIEDFRCQPGFFRFERNFGGDGREGRAGPGTVSGGA